MTDYIDFYTESELGGSIDDILEIEGINRVKELSRQLRTLFNYKAEVIQYRFQVTAPSNHDLKSNCAISKFYTQKREIESLSQEFISLLNNIKRDDTSLEQEIYNLHFKKNLKKLQNLSYVTEKIFTLIHVFSEDNIHDHPKFLKFIVVLTQHLCFVRKCLNVECYPFYEELEINYRNLEKELEYLLGDVLNVKNTSSKQKREERLIS